MPTNIDPKFSVYNLVERVKERHTAVIRHRRTMNAISHQIENATIVDGAKTRVFAAFQRMSRFLPQVERYRELSQHAESIYVFGVPDINPPELPKTHYVHLNPDDRLAQEWFLISYGQDYVSGLATRELTHIDDADDARRFEGVWTFDVRLVGILENWLSRIVNARPLGVSEETLNMNAQYAHIENILKRLEGELDSEISSQMDRIIRDEITSVIDTDVRPLVEK